MKHLTFPILISLFLISACTSSKPALKGEEPSGQPIQLFLDGSDDWFAEGDASWQFDNGELVGKLDSGAGFVITKASYTDFILELEFNPDSTINSGVFVRCGGESTAATDCYEINIWDLHPNQDYRTGAIVLRANPMAFVESLNKWNTYKIQCDGNRIQAWVNGTQTADLINDEIPTGYIALQAAENGEIRFRNVKLTVLE